MPKYVRTLPAIEAAPATRKPAHVCRQHQTFNDACTTCAHVMASRAARYQAQATREVGRIMRQALS